MVNFTFMKSKIYVYKLVIHSPIFKCFLLYFEKKIIFFGLSCLGVIVILRHLFILKRKKS